MAEAFDLSAVMAPKTKTNPKAAKQIAAKAQPDQVAELSHKPVGRRRTDGKVNLSFAVTKETRKALKAHALDRDETVQQVLEDALALLFAQRDIKR